MYVGGKRMLVRIFEELDIWVQSQNDEARQQGFLMLRPCVFQVVGQAGIIAANPNFDVTATQDLDAFTNAQHAIVEKLVSILAKRGIKYDLLSSEVWMPPETQYVELFKGRHVTAERSGLDYIMVSKAKMNPQKNKDLIQNYLAAGASDLFFELCKKYKIDLQSLLDPDK